MENKRNEAERELQGAVVPDLTDERELHISFAKPRNPIERRKEQRLDDSIGRNDTDLRGKVNSNSTLSYYSKRGAVIMKNYRCVFDADCLVPVEAFKTPKKRRVMEKTSHPRGQSNAAVATNQWRRLETAIIDAKDAGNATRFMRPSKVNFNLARVQLNVPNGPTKILFYAKRDIAKGEELTREP